MRGARRVVALLLFGRTLISAMAMGIANPKVEPLFTSDFITMSPGGRPTDRPAEMIRVGYEITG